MTRSLSRWQALLLGLVVLLGGAGAVVGLFATNSRYWPWDNSLRVRARFPKVNGVEPGTRVRVQGIDAGEVEEVLLPTEPGGPVTVVLRLKPAVRELIRSDAAAQIVSEGMVGGKVVELQPGTGPAAIANNAEIPGLPGADPMEMLARMGNTIQNLKNGDGTIGKLMSDPELYVEFLKTLKEGQQTLAAAQRDLDALKKVPGIGNYVENPNDLLMRFNYECTPYVFAEDDLFEPGRAVLTPRGRQALDGAGPEIARFKQKGTEVVVVSYADPKSVTGPQADKLTKDRSDVVVDYLKGQHKVDGPRLWGWWWSDRKVTPLGMGVRPAPTKESRNLPPGRTEVLVFVPQAAVPPK